MARFDGKVVIVTGAGSGIGAATARRFAEEGAKVALAGRRRDKLDETARGFSPDAVLIQETDVADERSVQALIDAATQRFGRLDTLVNNAGTAAFGSFTDLPLSEWRTVMSTNVDGVVYCCRAALPHLLETKGSIVNVSSVSGLGGDWGLAFYDASKGAVTNLTRALALEYGGRGVRVNAVNPSLTESEMSADLTSDEAVMAKFRERLPMGRPARPEEVAAVVAFLASPDAGYVNGVNLPVDGGVTASNGQPRLA